MAYCRILTVQDISCLGQCSATVALPVLSACGHETCILPSALLSTHTGGFGQVHKLDLTESFEDILVHWRSNQITFDAIYTGYLGSIDQIAWVKEIFKTMAAPRGARIVDPAMADNGKLYSGFSDEYVAQMKSLCAEADVLIPNVTEACLLTDTPYSAEPDEKLVADLLKKLSELCSCVILTGVGYEPAETGAVVYRDGKQWRYVQKKISKSYHGTGDIFASAFVGAWLQGKTIEDAVKIAADYTACCIQKTWESPAHWYGVKFEAALPELIAMLHMKQ